MTNQQHPITPPWELVQQWRHSWLPSHGEFVDYIAAQAAQWSADQELEACCEYIAMKGKWFADSHFRLKELRAARRPKPPSLKEQGLTALKLLKQQITDPNIIEPLSQAVEQLDD